MNEKKIYRIINSIIGIAFTISILFSIICTRQLNSARRLSDEYREQLDRAAATVGELTDTVGQCRSIVGELNSTASRNISTAREAIECLEEVRTQVYSLECITGDFSWNDYYSNLDSDIQKIKEE